jgi:hypothetical protein
VPIKVGQHRNHVHLRPIEERLWAKVDRGEGCWIWRGSTVPKGYGKIGRGRRGDGYAYAHRVAWELGHGPIPAGMAVMHSCDNPPCCRPDHLSLGTLAANNHDMATKGRHAAKLTLEQALEVRAAIASGESQRSVARRLGVYPQVVLHARRGKGWGLPDVRHGPAEDAL